jgi:glycosyltransferase involved in cell wall biosynthesis
MEANKFKDSIWAIEDKINSSDLVIALGRSAYEAMSCGRPVIIFDHRPYFQAIGDGYLLNDFNNYLKNNCSGRYSMKNFSEEELKSEFQNYKPKDSVLAREIAEKNFDIKIKVDEYLDFFQKNRSNKVIRFLKREIFYLFHHFGSACGKFLKNREQ